jgi:tape measure domain-containing protein
MADTVERIQIQVTDQGTADVIKALTELGFSMDEATKRIAAGMTKVAASSELGQQRLAAWTNIMKTGASDSDRFTKAINYMTAAELQMVNQTLSAATATEKLTATQRTANDAVVKTTAAFKDAENVQNSWARAVAQSGTAAANLAKQQVLAAQATKEVATASQAAANATEQGTKVQGAHQAAVGKTSQSYQLLARAVQTAVAYLSFKEIGKTLDTFSQLNAKLMGTSTAGDAVAKSFAKIIQVGQGATGAGASFAAIFQDLGNSANKASANIIKVGNEIDELNDTATVEPVKLTMEELAKDAEELAKKQAFATKAMDKLTDSSLKTGTALDKNVNTFSALNNATAKYGFSAGDSLRVTETLAFALRGAAAGGEAGARAMQQLTDGINAGVLRGQDLKAMLTAVPQLAKPIEVELGIAAGTLRSFAEDNDVSAKTIMNAFLHQEEAIRKWGATVPITISGAMENIHTSFIRMIGDMEKQYQVSEKVVAGFDFLRDHLKEVALAVGGFAAAWLAVKVGTVFVQMAQGVIALGSGLVTATAAVVRFGAALTVALIGNPIGAAITALVVGLGLLAYKFGLFDGLLGGSGGKFTAWAQQVQAAFGLGAKAADDTQVHWEGFVATSATTFAAAKDNVIDWATETTAQNVRAQTSTNEMYQALTFGSAKAKDAVKDDTKSMSSSFKDWYESSKKYISDFARDFREMIDDFPNRVSQLVSRIGSEFRSLGSAMMAPFTQFANWLGSTWVGSVLRTIDGFLDKAQAAIDRMKSSAQNSSQQTRDVLNQGGYNNFSISDVPGHRAGGSWSVPGAGAVDSTLVQFMASPGEQITVTTPAQTYGHNSVPHFRNGGSFTANDNIPHFRDGGNLAVTMGLSGIATYMESDQPQVTGYQYTPYNPGTVTTPAIDTPIETTPITVIDPPPVDGGGIVGNPIGGGDNGNDPLSDVVNSLSIYQTAPKLLYQRSVDAMSYLRKEASALAYLTSDAIKLLAAGHDVRFIYDGLDKAAVQRGALWVEGTDDIQQQFDKTEVNYMTSSHDYNPFATWPGGETGARLQLQNLINQGAIPWNGAKLQAEAASNNNFDRTNHNQSIMHARDGLEYDVPGAGAVDSRIMSLAVSPGEHVSVTTPMQQRSGDSAGGRQQIINMKVVTPDANSFRRSQTQQQQAVLRGLSRAARRG